jgi:hypothetical protein
MNGWTGPASWKVVGGMLVAAGQGDPAWAPFQAPSPDYAVEAEMQPIANNSNQWGVVTRGDPTAPPYAGDYYYVGINYGNTVVISPGIPLYQDHVTKSFTPGSAWHVFRVEAKGNHIKLLIDGSPVVETDNNLHLTELAVGLYSSGQVNVRSFKVIQL